MTDKQALWKWIILIALVGLSLWVVTPPFGPNGKIRLGLDLKGGTSFVVRLDRTALREEIQDRNPGAEPSDIDGLVKDALDGSTQRVLEILRNRINALGISEPLVQSQGDRIVIQLPGIDQTKQAEAERLIKSAAFLQFRLVHKNNDELVSKLPAKVSPPEGYRWSQDGPALTRDLSYTNTRDKAYSERLKRFHVPDPGYDFMLRKSERKGRTVYIPFYVKRRAEMKGDTLSTAKMVYGSMNMPLVLLEFDSQGRKDFAKITSYYCEGGSMMSPGELGRRLAIVLDGTLYSAPQIQSEILHGKAEIEGISSAKEAMLLANILNSGALPAPLEIIEKRFVAPSLGEDSIKSGMAAMLYGGIAVLIFMLVYYMVCGVVANLALLLNIILLPLGMVAAAGFLSLGIKTGGTGGGPIQLPVLTLPGIAGILLTIGMAVDANVLIFERIREEFRAGKRFWPAITAGYDRAFVTIVDANVTTLLTGMILFWFGSGPIRGFAVTLCAGIMASMFTSLVVTKLFFGVLARMTSLQTLKMLSVVKQTAIDFVGKRRVAALLSMVLIAGSLGAMTVKATRNPDAVFGVDFRGGSSLTYTFDQTVDRPEVNQVRMVLVGAGVPDAHIQYQDEFEEGGDAFLQIKTGSGEIAGQKPAAVVGEALAGAFAEVKFDLSQESVVGSQIGAEIKKDALWSIVIALLGIIIYLSWRFELGFAVGAIVALTHDVLMTMGLYCLFGRQISLPIVAALLTIVGYSVNDTIVVFDRIREDLRLVRNKTFPEICNLSINQTLSRTLLTSLTTMIAVVMLLVFGGGAINDFALALCIGVLVGTYSSIFVATPVVLFWHRNKKPDFAVATK